MMLSDAQTLLIGVCVQEATGAEMPSEKCQTFESFQYSKPILLQVSPVWLSPPPILKDATLKLS